MTFDGEDVIAKYLRFAERWPDFLGDPAETAGGIEILMDPADIARAQRETFDTRSRLGLSVSDVRAGLLAEDPYLVLVRDAVRFPNGSLGLYNRVLDPHAVAAMPLLDGKMVLVRVFRHGLRSWSLEFPRGSCDEGESPVDAMRRELREELGADEIKLADMGAFTPGGSTLGTRATFFAAEIDRLGRPDPSDAIERIELHDVAEVERKIGAGEIIDGWTMSLFLRARLAGRI